MTLPMTRPRMAMSPSPAVTTWDDLIGHLHRLVLLLPAHNCGVMQPEQCFLTLSLRPGVLLHKRAHLRDKLLLLVVVQRPVGCCEAGNLVHLLGRIHADD